MVIGGHLDHVIKFTILFESSCFRLSENVYFGIIVRGLKNMGKEAMKEKNVLLSFKGWCSALRHV